MNKVLAHGALVVFSVVAVSTQAPDRTQLREVGPAPALTPAIQRRQLSNGLPVWIVEHHALPVVQMSLLVLSGTDDDPSGRYGVASLTSAMLTEGAGSRSALELADAIDVLGANLSASSRVDSSSVQMYVPVARLADALPLMADVAQRPAFPKQELERVRQQRLVTLLNARDDPDAIASLAFARVIYGPSHRDGTDSIGTADTIKAFTPQDLDAFHKSAYRPGNSTLIVVGDVVRDEVMPLLETHFGKWQPPSVRGAMREPAPAPQNAPRRLILIDQPNAPQSRIVIGGVRAPMADFFPIQIMNTVLRGRFGLNPILLAYTAGVRSGFDVRKSPGPFVVAAAAQTDKTAESLTELLNALTGMLKQIPADELARATNEIALRFPSTFEATGRISSRLQALESLVVYGLPDDYYSKYVPAIQSVSAADVQRVAQQYIHPDHLAIVIVGDRKTIAPRIRALNLGSIKEMTIDEVFASGK